MRTSCIQHAPQKFYRTLWQDYLEIVDGDHCQAFLLDMFEQWHNHKLSQQGQSQKFNTTARKGGDAPDQYDGLLQWHDAKEIEAQLLGVYKKNAIATALRGLEGKGFISTHSNPNPRYAFDKTKFFLFYPETVQNALFEHSKKSVPTTEKSPSTVEINRCTVENGGSIQRIPSKETNKKNNNYSVSAFAETQKTETAHDFNFVAGVDIGKDNLQPEDVIVTPLESNFQNAEKTPQPPAAVEVPNFKVFPDIDKLIANTISYDPEAYITDKDGNKPESIQDFKKRFEAGEVFYRRGQPVYFESNAQNLHSDENSVNATTEKTPVLAAQNHKLDKPTTQTTIVDSGASDGAKTRLPKAEVSAPIRFADNRVFEFDRAHDRFWQLFKTWRNNASLSDPATNLREFKLIVTKDKRAPDQILAVYKYLLKRGRAKNGEKLIEVESISALREKFERIETEMSRKASENTPHITKTPPPETRRKIGLPPR